MRYTGGEIGAQAGEGAVLQDPDGADPLAEDQRDLLRGKVRHDAQQDHVPLVIAEPLESLLPLRVGLGVQRGRVGSRRGGRGLQLVGQRRFAPMAATLVDEAMVGHEEHPRPKARFVSLEAGQTPHQLKQHLPGEVVRVDGPLRSQVAADPSGDRPVQALPRPLSAGASRRQDLWEARTNRHHGIIGRFGHKRDLECFPDSAQANGPARPGLTIIDTSRVITLRYQGRLHHIGIGRAHKHTRVLILVADLDIRIITQDGGLLRHLTLDPNRDCQPIKPASSP